jgi:NAD(P)-dependent dehydrogenase (short-subunit alcohol dehydrogenase family)
LVTDPFGYSGRRAVVTGCSSGIGEATAVLATSLGADVVGVDVKPPSVDLAGFVPCDLGDPAAVDRAAAAIDPPVDALFNCAGVSSGAADPMTVLRVNFLGLRRLTEALVPRMLPGSAVASIASLGGFGWDTNLAAIHDFLEQEHWDDAVRWVEAHPEQIRGGAYGFSKQAVIVYTKQHCIPWAERGVRANVIGPSPVDTPMLADTVRATGPEYLERFPRPIGRNSTAAEQANVLVFLNSPAASYVTGQLIWTDGGYMAGVVTGQLASVVGGSRTETR